MLINGYNPVEGGYSCTNVTGWSIAFLAISVMGHNLFSILPGGGVSLAKSYKLRRPVFKSIKLDTWFKDYMVKLVS